MNYRLRASAFSVCCAVLAIAALGSAALAVAATRAPSSARAAKADHASKTHKVAHVTVTATEFKYKLSARKVPVGTVVFKVVNKGKIAHDFKIHGKKTKVLKPGKSALLKVVFKKKGTYVYICTVPGHAAAGMKGYLGVGMNPKVPKKAKPKPKPAPAPTPTTSTPAPAPTPTSCTSPKSTTVTVDEFEFDFKLSSTTVPCGTVTFVQKNTGAVAHDFNLEKVTGGSGALINPGQSTTMTVTIAPGKYTYLCDVSGHAEAGMIGSLTVTG